MKLDKDIREMLYAKFIYKKNSVDMGEVIDYLEKHCPPPDFKALVAKEFTETARRYITGQKDSRGRRRFYAPERDGVYINVETLDTPEALAVIEDQQKRRAEQTMRSGEKVKKRRLLLAGEIDKEDWDAFLGEYEIVGE